MCGSVMDFFLFYCFSLTSPTVVHVLHVYEGTLL